MKLVHPYTHVKLIAAKEANVKRLINIHRAGGDYHRKSLSRPSKVSSTNKVSGELVIILSSAPMKLS
ncbi:10329_t:CDS:2 [Scutellospora calospora]|uniref:10329_t:CDS:1 n=1 Tax=Scutellospora calospora TaxID=85575 RepID=A0ACA9KAT1_9GLOM|nr:10329_t:CDS:2 [Scutellospora calospora]